MVILYIYSTCCHMKLVFYERQQSRREMEQLTGGEILPVTIVMRKSDGVDYSRV
jgi:hypothetical protein